MELWQYLKACMNMCMQVCMYADIFWYCMHIWNFDKETENDSGKETENDIGKRSLKNLCVHACMKRANAWYILNIIDINMNLKTAARNRNENWKRNFDNICMHAWTSACKYACMLTFFDTDIVNMHQHLEIEARTWKL